MRHSLTTLTTLIAVCSTGCTSDLRAPSNYQFSDDSSAGAMLELDCGAVPMAAVGAEFSHTVTATGGEGTLAYAFAEDSPPPAGFEIDEDTGEITGIPSSTDEIMLSITVTDDMFGAGDTMCPVSVNPMLAVALNVESPGCLSTAQNLREVVVEGTGDGSEILCAAPAGRGNGRMPDGHSVGDKSCEVEGTLQENRFGTWVIMMRGTQSGVDVWVPFCITNDNDAGSYTVGVAHSGEADATFAPLIGTFDPNASFGVGMPGDPHFTVADAASCGAGGGCSYGFNYSVTSNGFTDTDLDALVVGDGLLSDDAGARIGMQHDLVRLEGSELAEGLRDRPWTLSLGLEYCISETQAECTGAAIQTNAGARFEFSVLMFPDPA